MGQQADPINRILSELTDGGADQSAVARLLPDVYSELRRIAAGCLAGERSNHTLQATALVHEAYLRLAGSAGQGWKDRAHFLRAAAKTMRHILIDHYRRYVAEKRGGGEPNLKLTETAILLDDKEAEILAVDDALQRLFALSPEKARVVELRIFGGCTIEETAEALGISTATVERDWRFARAWLKSQLDGDG
ncbi:MAG: sigma-70 family RNA polymerase sigma factor [Phycisphaerae bacterium]